MTAHHDQSPADTRMMSVVHSALRRDLERTRLVLAAGHVADARRTALARHLDWVVTWLRHHHENEDAGLYPLALARDPGLAGLLATMHDEHEAMDPALLAVEVAARAWAASDEARPQLQDAVEQLRAVALPHLEHEETVLMPRVSRALTQREWTTWDRETNIEPKRPSELAFEGHWFLDGVTPEVRRMVTALVPPVQRFVLVHLLAGPYRRRSALLWAGTPAAAVPSLTAQAVAGR